MRTETTWTASPDGKTTYVLVQYGNDVPQSHETVLLVALKTPVILDKAVVSVDDVLQPFKARGLELPHPGVINTARQGGAVMSLPLTTGKFQLLPLLVR